MISGLLQNQVLFETLIPLLVQLLGKALPFWRVADQTIGVAFFKGYPRY